MLYRVVRPGTRCHVVLDMKTVPRVGRLLDLVGLVLFAGGGAAVIWAWLGFRRVMAYEAPSDAPAWSAVEMANGYWRTQKIGVVLMVAGIAVFVVAWRVARAAMRRESLAAAPDVPG